MFTDFSLKNQTLTATPYRLSLLTENIPYILGYLRIPFLHPILYISATAVCVRGIIHVAHNM